MVVVVAVTPRRIPQLQKQAVIDWNLERIGLPRYLFTPP
jgi:hypothetical protein